MISTVTEPDVVSDMDVVPDRETDSEFVKEKERL